MEVSMKRAKKKAIAPAALPLWSSVLLISLVLILSPSTLAQDEPLQPTPVVPGSILGTQLIVWSQAQKPQPVPQPLPPPDSVPQPPTQSPTQSQTDAQTQTSEDQAQPATQTFTGMIAKVEGKYVLKISVEKLYQIDDQEKAKRFEGRKVTIVGTLDASGSTVHVSSIEALS
jgi:Protein of unknown function (DUF5818)